MKNACCDDDDLYRLGEKIGQLITSAKSKNKKCRGDAGRGIQGRR